MTDHSTALTEAVRLIEERLPEVAAAARRSDCPKVRIECPRDHEIIPVTLEADYNGHPVLQAVGHEEERLHRHRRQVSEGQQSGSASSICAEPGCPNLTTEHFCDEHLDPEDQSAGWINMMAAKLNLDCPKCSYHGSRPTAGLILLVAAAIQADQPVVRLDH